MVELLMLTILLAVFGWFLSGRVRGWAGRCAVVDVPNDRSLHSRPVPTGGGLVIAGLCLGGVSLAWGCGLVELDRQWMGYLAAAAVVASISWADDLRPLSSRLRLVVHTLAAGLLLASGPCWDCIELPWFGVCPLGHWGVLVAMVWLVGLTNAYNFMDGLDGLAGTQAILAAVGWLVLGGLTGQGAIVLAAVLLLGGSGGFLVHNWPPARLFMGDVGSTFLGFTFAAMGLMAARNQPRLAVAAVLVVWPFVFDAGITFLRRLIRREDMFTAHRTHLYQRLAAAGWPASRVVLLYGCLALVGLSIAVRFVLEPGAGWPTVLIIPALGCGLWQLVRHREAWAAAQGRAATAGGAASTTWEKPFWIRVSPGTVQRGRATDGLSTSAADLPGYAPPATEVPQGNRRAG